ncbi:MAG: serine/threonine protein kinase [Gammaproteobacteria bacterium]|nr:serine/threonine protein kinase [Gammaproteobacteria bacterium]
MTDEKTIDTGKGNPFRRVDEKTVQIPVMRPVVRKNAQRNGSGQSAQNIRVGSILKQRFRLETYIAKGGMGDVYKARDLRKVEANDRDPFVAIKILRRKLNNKKDAFIALQREARKSQILAHPNIITVHDFDRDGDVFMMVMEFLQGKTLLQAITHKGKSKALPEQQGFQVIESIGNALSYAHSKNIIHCDLKPANIFIDDDGVVKVLDFGIAQAIQSSRQLDEDSGLVALTPTYASCEMLQGETPDARDDIYGFACISYEILTGVHPYERKSSVEAHKEEMEPKPVDSLSPRQWKMLRQGMSFDREDRPASVEQFLDELIPGRLQKAGRKNIWLLSGVLVITAALLVFVLTQKQVVIPEKIVAAPFNSLTQQIQEQVLGLLEIADAHMMVKRYTEPPGSNAYAAYKQVLEIHPGNSQALSGLERIADEYAKLARTYISAGNSQMANDLIKEGLEISPGYKDLLELQKSLE